MFFQRTRFLACGAVGISALSDRERDMPLVVHPKLQREPAGVVGAIPGHHAIHAVSRGIALHDLGDLARIGIGFGLMAVADALYRPAQGHGTVVVGAHDFEALHLGIARVVDLVIYLQKRPRRTIPPDR